MQSVTCALVPSVPEEGSRQCAPFGAHLEDSIFLKNSGTRGGGSWDRKAKGRLPNSALPISPEAQMTCPKCGRRDVPKRPDKTRHCRRCGPLQTFRFPRAEAASA